MSKTTTTFLITAWLLATSAMATTIEIPGEIETDIIEESTVPNDITGSY